MNGHAQKQLATALMSAFPTRAKLERMVAHQLNENLNAIAPENADLTATTFTLVQWAVSKGKLHALINGAQQECQDNPYLAAIAVPPPPSPASPALGVTPSPQREPTRASLRRLLAKVLPSVPDLNAFVIDHFPEVAGEYVGGMDRTERMNVLLSPKRKPSVILAALRKAYPDEVREHEGLLAYE